MSNRRIQPNACCLLLVNTWCWQVQGSDCFRHKPKSIAEVEPPPSRVFRATISGAHQDLIVGGTHGWRKGHEENKWESLEHGKRRNIKTNRERKTNYYSEKIQQKGPSKPSKYSKKKPCKYAFILELHSFISFLHAKEPLCARAHTSSSIESATSRKEASAKKYAKTTRRKRQSSCSCWYACRSSEKKKMRKSIQISIWRSFEKSVLISKVAKNTSKNPKLNCILRVHAWVRECVLGVFQSPLTPHLFIDMLLHNAVFTAGLWNVVSRVASCRALSATFTTARSKEGTRSCGGASLLESENTTLRGG